MSTTDTACTCPSGDGSLRWPCPTHPPTERDERLRGIQERRKAVSDGPWEADGGVVRCHSGQPGDDGIDLAYSGQAEAIFIAAALDDVPWLLAEVARLDAVVTAVRRFHTERPWRQADGMPLGGTVCNHCRTMWPCSTVIALDGVDRQS